ncbi:hypothetical protein LCD36_04640 [Saccharopolyspora sp. 6T]|uniref:hypothetical protein n=1 Tax=Saccharopolyspora sp. 6T TaxID=2877238 RepID=UPI001CD4DFA7|nr:hypothetical protein [Saccharopolyspora sp. 6T]MCA1185740.1 hypothetical protein [Saccharopolyspora sp. 6T]
MSFINIGKQTHAQLTGIVTERSGEIDAERALKDLVGLLEDGKTWTSREVLEELADLMEVEEMAIADYPDLDVAGADDEDED